MLIFNVGFVCMWVYRLHTNEYGIQVHGRGQCAPAALPWGPRCAIAPSISLGLKNDIIDSLRAKWSVADIFDLHCRKQFDLHGVDRGADVTETSKLLTLNTRDDLLTKRDIYNLKKHIDKETWKYDENDVVSVSKWMSLNRDRWLLHKPYAAGPPLSKFLLVLQSRLQLLHMIEMSHGSVLCLDSTFATNKYQVRT